MSVWKLKKNSFQDGEREEIPKDYPKELADFIEATWPQEATNV
jgi:hypothetical protein